MRTSATLPEIWKQIDSALFNAVYTGTGGTMVVTLKDGSRTRIMAEQIRDLSDRLLAVAYVAARIQITVLRGGVDWQAVFAGGRNAMQLAPLKTTLGELRLGLWPLIYHVVGNMIWFVPLGLLLRRKKWYWALIAGAAFSVGIEVMQYLLITGMTDIADVILNAFGTLIGWWMGRITGRKKAA